MHQSLNSHLDKAACEFPVHIYHHLNWFFTVWFSVCHSKTSCTHTVYIIDIYNAKNHVRKTRITWLHSIWGIGAVMNKSKYHCVLHHCYKTLRLRTNKSTFASFVTARQEISSLWPCRCLWLPVWRYSTTTTQPHEYANKPARDFFFFYLIWISVPKHYFYTVVTFLLSIL